MPTANRVIKNTGYLYARLVCEVKRKGWYALTSIIMRNSRIYLYDLPLLLALPLERRARSRRHVAALLLGSPESWGRHRTSNGELDCGIVLRTQVRMV